MLSDFPKTRPALPAAQQAIYEQEYKANRDGQTFMASLSQKLESWMHRQVMAQVKGKRFLEIGGGTLNHVPYMNEVASDYYDVVEPAKFLYENSPNKTRIRHFYNDINECSDKYDSIFSIAAMEHITNLPYVLAKIGLLLTSGGVCVSAIPCEGGLLWGLSWRLSTGLAYKLRTGHSYKNVMRHEHVNNYDEIIALHKHFFSTVRVTHFPLAKHSSFYACVVASEPKLTVCQEYLSKK